MKRCTGCDTAKPLTEFYRAKNTRDGVTSRCKECTRSQVNAYRAANIELVRERDRQRGRTDAHRARVREYHERAAQRDPDRVMRSRKATLARYDERFPEKAAARAAVGKALRSGRLTRQPCEVCGRADAEAHHDDYSKPLDVKWLCSTHHAARHVELREAERAIALQKKQSA